MSFEAPLILVVIAVLLLLIPLILAAVLISILALAWPILLALGIAILVGVAIGAVRFETRGGNGYSLRIHVRDPWILLAVFLAVLIALILAPLVVLTPPHHPPAWR